MAMATTFSAIFSPMPWIPRIIRRTSLSRRSCNEKKKILSHVGDEADRTAQQGSDSPPPYRDCFDKVFTAIPTMMVQHVTLLASVSDPHSWQPFLTGSAKLLFRRTTQRRQQRWRKFCGARHPVLYLAFRMPDTTGYRQKKKKRLQPSKTRFRPQVHVTQPCHASQRSIWYSLCPSHAITAQCGPFGRQLLWSSFGRDASSQQHKGHEVRGSPQIALYQRCIPALLLCPADYLGVSNLGRWSTPDLPLPLGPRSPLRQVRCDGARTRLAETGSVRFPLPVFSSFSWARLMMARQHTRQRLLFQRISQTIDNANKQQSPSSPHAHHL